jgi:peptidyl-prolyl cis-trans isomerase SurA
MISFQMKKTIVAMTMLLCGSMAFAQTDDPVIMTIAGHPVQRSEFEYSYNKNNSEGVIDKKTVEEYVDLFVNYKLKVQAALDAKLDTMISYQKEFRTYRDQQITPSFVTDEAIEKEALQVYQNTKESIGPRGLIMPAHILILLNQKATDEEQKAAKVRIDSVYQALKQGADFEALAKKVSQDPGSASKGGVLPWIGPNQTLKEFEDAAYALKVGELSQPVLSPAGWHIILMKDRKQLEPYDSLRSDILKFLEARNVRDRLAEQAVDSIAKQRNITRDELLDERSAELQAKDVELDNLVREYHDGLLLYEISNREVWEKAAKDEAGLANYFSKNKKKYKWDQPRYKGMVYHVKEKDDVKAVKNSVKGLEFTQWADKLRKTFNNDSIIRIRVEKGIFKKGDNAFIDKMVFKKKDAKVTPVKDYPIDAVYGKILKKGPEEYEDVKGLVTADYQEELEKGWVATLRRKYQVKVYDEVVKTVNKH